MENFKDITEHQLEVGEVGVLKGNKYLACKGCNNHDYDCYKCTFSATNNSDECMNSNIHCNNIFFQLVAKKEDIDPILESIDDTSNDDSDPNSICCEHFKTFIPLFSWFTINEDTLIMPNIDNIRVQYCPSCGKYIRDIQLSKRDSLQYFK